VASAAGAPGCPDGRAGCPDGATGACRTGGLAVRAFSTGRPGGLSGLDWAAVPTRCSLRPDRRDGRTPSASRRGPRSPASPAPFSGELRRVPPRPLRFASPRGCQPPIFGAPREGRIDATRG
jgi:hypothetical protein